MKLFLIIGFFFGSMSFIAQTNNEITFLNFKLLPQSSIDFIGTSTINTFNFSSKKLKGSGAYIFDNNLRDSSYVADVTVDVESFDSGSNLMNSDMYDALKYEQYPIINFKLLKINKVEKPNNKDILYANITGLLTVAGKSNNLKIKFNIEKNSDSTYYLKGNKSISMLDFDIDPPSKLFGLIQVHDTLNVNFNLFVNMKRSIISSKLKKITYHSESRENLTILR